MWVNKIIFVTPWSLDKYPGVDGTTDRLGGLSKDAQAQLNNVISFVLKPEVEEKPLAYRIPSRTDPASDSIAYLSHHFRGDDAEDTVGNYVANPENIEDVITSTKTAEVIVLWLMQVDLKQTLESLKNTWYEVIDPQMIKHYENIYVVSVDVKTLQTTFKEFPSE